jgi:energy-coupling factor transport system permease protein
VEIVSNAMDLRGFGKHKKRTWYSFKPLHKGDAAAIIVSGVILLISLAVTLFINHGRFWNPFLH